MLLLSVFATEGHSSMNSSVTTPSSAICAHCLLRIPAICAIQAICQHDGFAKKMFQRADMGPVQLHSLSHTAKAAKGRESENKPVTSRLQERYSKYAKVISTVELIV